jgi:hypothetical protein
MRTAAIGTTCSFKSEATQSTPCCPIQSNFWTAVYSHIAASRL